MKHYCVKYPAQELIQTKVENEFTQLFKKCY